MKLYRWLLFALITMHAHVCGAQDDWRPMSTAPRDGTVVEIMNTYGVAPWYGLFKWSATQELGGPQDEAKQCDNSPGPYELWPQHNVLGFTWGGFTDEQWNDWMAKHCHDQPKMTFRLSSPKWVGVDQTGTSIDCSDESTCHWRPYNGLGAYHDPTNGAQRTPEYWRRAAGIN